MSPAAVSAPRAELSAEVGQVQLQNAGGASVAPRTPTQATRSRRRFELPLAAPDADYPDTILAEAVDDPEGRIDDLAQLDEPELRHHATALREVGQPLDVRNDLAQQALPDLGDLLAGVPGADRLEVRDGGGGEADARSPRHASRGRAAA